MKKRIIMLIVFAIVLSLFSALTASANEYSELVEVIEYDNGCYLEITMQSIPVKASGSITKTKNYIYHNTSGDSLWKVSLTGSFTYTGTSATCTASSCSVTIYSSSWYLISKSSSKSGNTAYGSATLGRKVLGVTVEQKTYNLTLTCDKNGNVS